jgi:two-component system, chemotaxis family, sensor histidine kinase and response regulator PixL
VRLGRWLRFNCPRPSYAMETPPAINAPSVLIVNRGRELVAMQVDRAWLEQEVAVRRVEGNLPLPPGFSGCTVFGDGRVVPLVNVTEMLNWVTICERSPDAIPSGSPLGLPALNLPTVHKTTILIIDDSINVRRFLALTLERSGYRVEQAKDGQEAIDKLQAGLAVQGIICDVEMPRLDGFGFLAKMKATPALASVPVTMLTSRSGDKHRKLATSLGAAAYFPKPYNEQALLSKLAELVKQPVGV